jgi:hypothetical protein
MTKAEEKEIRAIVRSEILGIIEDAQEALGKKDPTGFGRKAMDGLCELIRRRESATPPESD